MSRLISCLSYGAFIGSTRKPSILVSRQFSALATANGISSGHYNHTQHQFGHNSTKKSIDGTKFLVGLSHNNNLINTSRNIFTDNSLGIPKLDELRERKRNLFSGEAKDRYIERLKDYVAKGDCKSIYRDDLVNLLGIAENEQHLDLLEEIVAKSDGEQAEFFRGWGATIMRLYYKMNQLERAEKNIRDIQRFGEFFNLRSCYKILMTMLYNTGQYEKVVDMLHFAEERFKDRVVPEGSLNEGAIFDRDLATLTFAALAKLDGHSALEQAEQLYSKMITSERNLGLRPSSFVAYIAIKNNNPKFALNLISKIPSRNYVSLREIKIISLIQLERYEDVLLAMREHATNLKRDSNLLLKSTFDVLQQCKDKIQDDAIRQELDDILIGIKEGGHISEQNLDDLIFRQIDYDRSQARTNDTNNFRSGTGQRGGQFGRERPPFRRNQYNDDNYQDEDNESPRYSRNNESPRYSRDNESYRYPRDNESSRYSRDQRSENRGGFGGGRGGKRFSHQNVDFDA